MMSLLYLVHYFKDNLWCWTVSCYLQYYSSSCLHQSTVWRVEMSGLCSSRPPTSCPWSPMSHWQCSCGRSQEVTLTMSLRSVIPHGVRHLYRRTVDMRDVWGQETPRDHVLQSSLYLIRRGKYLIGVEMYSPEYCLLMRLESSVDTRLWETFVPRSGCIQNIIMTSFFEGISLVLSLIVFIDACGIRNCKNNVEVMITR